MKILFATGRTFVPDRVGGAARSAHTLLELLHARGHRCEAIALIPEGWRHQVLRGLRTVSGRRWAAVRHRHNGYVTLRALPRTLHGVFRSRLRAFQPDLVLTQLEASETFAHIALQSGVPVALRVPDVSFTHFSGRLSDATVLVFANSRFVARRLHERFGISAPTVYSPVRVDRYRIARDGADRITFVNPRPFKGLDLALEIARLLPGRRFLFQEAWRFEHHEVRRLRSRLAAYPNVTFSRLTQDMRRVYAVTRLLIVPSLCEDSLPRVILEAQASGVPVLARNVGGVAEALIAGGQLLSPSATAAEWAEVIEAILDDAAGYERLSVEAERNARQPAFDPETIVDRFLDIVGGHIARCAASGELAPRVIGRLTQAGVATARGPGGALSLRRRTPSRIACQSSQGRASWRHRPPDSCRLMQPQPASYA